MSAPNTWEQFLSPEVTRERLVSASLFITAFELLKDSIVRKLRDYYSIGFDASGATVSPDYLRRVLDRNKSVLYASLAWLEESGAVTPSDLESFERIKTARNAIAHGLPELVFNGVNHGLEERFGEAVALLRKIEVWWVVNVDIATDPDYDGAEIDEDKITPGSVLMLQLMLDVASGNEQYLNHFRKAAAGNEI